MSARSLLYLSVTSAAARTAEAFSSAKRPALFLILVQLPSCKKDNYCHNYSYNNRTHNFTTFPKISVFVPMKNHRNANKIDQALTLTFLVSLLLSLYGLASKYTIIPRMITAKISPITFTEPVKSSPN